MRIEYDERKLREMVLYVASRLRDHRSGGATNLNEVVFLSTWHTYAAPGRRSPAPRTRSSTTNRWPDPFARFVIG